MVQDNVTVEQLNDKVELWAAERNMYDKENGSTPMIQLFKYIEELGETFGAILKNKDSEELDGHGDLQVVMVNIKRLFADFLLTQQDNPLTDTNKYMLLMLSDIGMLANSLLDADETKLYDNVQAADFEEDLHSLMYNHDMLMESRNVDKTHCLQLAYNEIKDRKGQMINRNFVKEQDIA